MKVSYYIPGSGQGSATVLFDETASPAGQLLENFEPSTREVVQETPLFRSGAQFRNPRQNYQAQFTLKFNVEYADRATCLASFYALPVPLMAQKVHLIVQQDGTTLYYPNAQASSHVPRLNGSSADHTFQFTSDLVTTTAPT